MIVICSGNKERSRIAHAVLSEIQSLVIPPLAINKSIEFMFHNTLDKITSFVNGMIDNSSADKHSNIAQVIHDIIHKNFNKEIEVQLIRSAIIQIHDHYDRKIKSTEHIGQLLDELIFKPSFITKEGFIFIKELIMDFIIHILINAKDIAHNTVVQSEEINENDNLTRVIDISKTMNFFISKIAKGINYREDAKKKIIYMLLTAVSLSSTQYIIDDRRNTIFLPTFFEAIKKVHINDENERNNDIESYIREQSIKIGDYIDIKKFNDYILQTIRTNTLMHIIKEGLIKIGNVEENYVESLTISQKFSNISGDQYPDIALLLQEILSTLKPEQPHELEEYVNQKLTTYLQNSIKEKFEIIEHIFHIKEFINTFITPSDVSLSVENTMHTIANLCIQNSDNRMNALKNISKCLLSQDMQNNVVYNISQCVETFTNKTQKPIKVTALNTFLQNLVKKYSKPAVNNQKSNSYIMHEYMYLLAMVSRIEWSIWGLFFFTAKTVIDLLHIGSSSYPDLFIAFDNPVTGLIAYNIADRNDIKEYFNNWNEGFSKRFVDKYLFFLMTIYYVCVVPVLDIMKKSIQLAYSIVEEFLMKIYDAYIVPVRDTMEKSVQLAYIIVEEFISQDSLYACFAIICYMIHHLLSYIPYLSEMAAFMARYNVSNSDHGSQVNMFVNTFLPTLSVMPSWTHTFIKCLLLQANLENSSITSQLCTAMSLCTSPMNTGISIAMAEALNFLNGRKINTTSCCIAAISFLHDIPSSMNTINIASILLSTTPILIIGKEIFNKMDETKQLNMKNILNIAPILPQFVNKYNVDANSVVYFASALGGYNQLQKSLKTKGELLANFEDAMKNKAAVNILKEISSKKHVEKYTFKEDIKQDIQKLTMFRDDMTQYIKVLNMIDELLNKYNTPSSADTNSQMDETEDTIGLLGEIANKIEATIPKSKKHINLSALREISSDDINDAIEKLTKLHKDITSSIKPDRIIYTIFSELQVYESKNDQITEEQKQAIQHSKTELYQLLSMEFNEANPNVVQEAINILNKLSRAMDEDLPQDLENAFICDKAIEQNNHNSYISHHEYSEINKELKECIIRADVNKVAAKHNILSLNSDNLKESTDRYPNMNPVYDHKDPIIQKEDSPVDIVSYVVIGFTTLIGVGVLTFENTDAGVTNQNIRVEEFADGAADPVYVDDSIPIV